jgi:hypothetical protein
MVDFLVLVTCGLQLLAPCTKFFLLNTIVHMEKAMFLELNGKKLPK